MKVRRVEVLLVRTAAAIVAIACIAPAWSQVKIDDNGTVHVPAYEIPLSSYMSEAAKQAFIAAAHAPPEPQWNDVNASITTLRRLSARDAAPFVARTKKRYPVDIVNGSIAGVQTRTITPRDGIAARNRYRVLLELHGGGFFSGANNESLMESIPIAAVGRFKVIAVNYREGPEYRFPAASEDVASVYRQLLKTYRAADIGMYGCSAGGTLAAQAVAWFQKEKLPPPGAIGIISAGAFGDFAAPPSNPGSWGGDSRYTTPALNGDPPLPINPKDVPPFPKVMTAYMQGIDLLDPLASPALSRTILARFPPTLVITSTRGFDMSAAVQTHRLLVDAGVHSDLDVWDGLGHCFYTDVNLPESREAYSVITDFFNRWLGRRPQ